MNWDLLASTIAGLDAADFRGAGRNVQRAVGRDQHRARRSSCCWARLRAAVGTLVTHSPWLGSAFGMAAGVLLAAVYALFVIRLRADQIVAGVAINMLAMGLTPFMCKILYDVTGSTPSIPLHERFQSAPLYLCWALVAACVLVGEIYADRFVGQFRRRTSRGARRGGDSGQSRPLDGGAGQRRAGGDGRRIVVGVSVVVVLARHDGGARVHGVGGADLREMETAADGAGVFVVRVCRCRADSAPGRGVFGAGNPSPWNSSRFFPIS